MFRARLRQLCVPSKIADADGLAATLTLLWEGAGRNLYLRDEACLMAAQLPLLAARIIEMYGGKIGRRNACSTPLPKRDLADE
jgi:hypothetical protein